MNTTQMVAVVGYTAKSTRKRVVITFDSEADFARQVDAWAAQERVVEWSRE